MNKLIFVFAFTLSTASAFAGITENFRCIAVERKGRIDFYTNVDSYYGRMQVRYADSYYGNGGEVAPQIDRAFDRESKGTNLVFTVPGVGRDQITLTIDTASQARMPGGKRWVGNSRVHKAALQFGDEVALPTTCELLQY